MWVVVRSKELNNAEKHDLLLDFDRVLGLGLKKEENPVELTEEIQGLIEEREEARKSGNYKHADEIRAQLKLMGIILEDTAKGVRWKRNQKSDRKIQ